MGFDVILHPHYITDGALLKLFLRGATLTEDSVITLIKIVYVIGANCFAYKLLINVAYLFPSINFEDNQKN